MLSSVAGQTLQWAKGKASGTANVQQFLRIPVPKSGPYFTVVVGNLKAEGCQLF